MTRQDFVIKFASDNLGSIPRASYGTAFDHGYRVAEYLRTKLEIYDPIVYAIALLHDIFEDTDTDRDVMLHVFGSDVVEGIELLTRKGERPKSDDEILRVKIEQNLQLMDEPMTVRLIKCADRIDNLTDALNIPPKSTKYQRVPYWAIETKLSMFTVARMTNKTLYDDMVDLTRQIEDRYPDEIYEIEIKYITSKNQERLKLDERKIFR